jgi:hypothetical protein
MFQTHYARQRPKQRWDDDKGPLLTPLESVLYAVAPEDILFTKDVLYSEFTKKIFSKLSEYGKLPTGRKALDAAVDTLCEKGFLKEIYGTRISKFLSSF